MKKIIFMLLIVFSSLSFTKEMVGNASWYGESWNGKKTANGEIFNSAKMTCASNSHKMGTNIEVTNLSNGKSIVCRVNDTGGFAKYGRILDMSKGAFSKIGNVNKGVIKVKIRVVK